MALADARVRATIAVSDMDRAIAFYEGVLGLAQLGETMRGQVRIYPCGRGTLLQVYASEHAGTGSATVASWSADDFDGVVDALVSAGVVFDTYEGMPADERGVHAFGTHRVVWFRDPDGNVLSLDNGASPG